jgi:hypothetical protein
MYKYIYDKKPEALLVSSMKVGLEEMPQKLSVCSCLMNRPQKAGAHPKEGRAVRMHPPPKKKSKFEKKILGL